MDLRPPSEEVVRKEVAALGRRAVHRERVNLAGCVYTPNEAVAISSSGITADDDDLSVQRRPLALDPDEAGVEVEEHVVSPALADRPIDVNPELRCVVHDRLLGGVSLLISCEHASDASLRIGWAVS